MKSLAERLADRPPPSAEQWQKAFKSRPLSIDGISLKDAEIVSETDLAVCVKHDAFEVTTLDWVPKSLLLPESIRRPGQKGTLVVSGWFAEKRGWRL